jgi:MFS family permease
VTPAFRFLVTGRVITMAGNALAPIALAFAVLDLTGSAADLGLVVGARSLANVVLLLFGGVLADRLPRRTMLIGSSLLAMLSQGAVAALLLTGHAGIPVLIGLSIVNGAAAAMAQPATSALVAQTVPPELNQKANAINRLLVNAAMIAGAAAGGVLVATIGPGWGIGIDAASFGLAALAYAGIRVPDYRRPDPHGRSLWRDLREGWQEFASRRWVWVVVLGFCLFNAAEVGALNVIGPLMADQSFGRPAWGFILAAETAGMVLGAFVAMRLRVRRFLLIGVVCCLPPAGWLFALALSTDLVLLLPVSFLTGVAIEQFAVAWEVSVQEHIPPDRLARVYSFDALGSFVAIPLGQVAAGPIAAAVGPRTALLGAGALIVLAVLGMLTSRGVRTLVHVLPPAPTRAETMTA